MKQKTKETIIEVIRWVAFLPVEFVCFVLGYALAINLIGRMHIHDPWATIIGFLILGMFDACGARLLVPKHKTLATILAVAFTVVFLGLLILAAHEGLLG